MSILCHRYYPFWGESICQERCQDARPRYCVQVPWFSCLFGITDSHRLSNTGPVHTNLEIFETAYLLTRIRVDGSLARGRGDFRWQGWSNGGKNQNPKKYLDQNLTPKKSLAEFPSHKNFPESIKWSNYHDLSDCFEYPEKCLPKSSCPKFSYPKKSRNRKFQIQTFWIVVQFLARKPVNFASLLTAKFLKLWTWMQTRQTQNSFSGPKSYWDFPETGPCMGLHCIKKNRLGRVLFLCTGFTCCTCQSTSSSGFA